MWAIGFPTDGMMLSIYFIDERRLIMLKYIRRSFPAVLYLSETALSILLWLGNTNLYHFMGASSMIYSFIYTAFAEERLLLFAFCYFLLCLLLLFLSVLFSLLRRYTILIGMISIDIILSIAVIVEHIIIRHDYQLIESIIGVIVRILIGAWIVFDCKSIAKRESKDERSSMT